MRKHRVISVRKTIADQQDANALGETPQFVLALLLQATRTLIDSYFLIETFVRHQT